MRTGKILNYRSCNVTHITQTPDTHSQPQLGIKKRDYSDKVFLIVFHEQSQHRLSLTQYVIPHLSLLRNVQGGVAELSSKGLLDHSPENRPEHLELEIMLPTWGTTIPRCK